MATNLKDRAGIGAPSLPNQQFYLVCGPIQTKQPKFRSLRRFARKYIWKAANLLLLGGALFFGWRIWTSLSPKVSVSNWWCEFLALALFGLIVWLFRTFRIWHRERNFKATGKRLRQEEIPVLMCTPPPIDEFEAGQFTHDDEFTIIIDNWRSFEVEDAVSPAIQAGKTFTSEATAITMETEKAA